MKKKISLSLLLIQCLLLLSAAKDFDFFYLVLQWPGSYCDTQQGCCYPKWGKPPADFGVHGLWPNFDDGTYPSNCDSNSPFDPTQVSSLTNSLRKDWPTLACPSGDGQTFWSHEWVKHGTCSESVLDQHGYFEAALSFKTQLNLLQSLEQAGINPDGSSYSLTEVRDTMKKAVGFTPWIQCNTDESGNSQIYQVYFCVDNSGSDFIECPVFPHVKCGSNIVFPKF